MLRAFATAGFRTSLQDAGDGRAGAEQTGWVEAEPSKEATGPKVRALQNATQSGAGVLLFRAHQPALLVLKTSGAMGEPEVGVMLLLRHSFSGAPVPCSARGGGVGG